MDLKIKDLAELLNVSETTIRRWLAEGKIPAYRLNHQFRFSRSEIEDWVMSCKIEKKQVRPSPVSTLQNMKKVASKGGTRQFNLYRSVNRGGVFLEESKGTKEEIIRSCVRKIAKNMNLDADVLSDLLMDRENKSSTSLNHGIAVPHTRDFLLQESYDVVAIVYLSHPIEYGALDGKPVHTLFFLFACNDKNHLNLLAKLAHCVVDKAFRKYIETKPKKTQLLKFIKEFEAKLPALASS